MQAEKARLTAALEFFSACAPTPVGPTSGFYVYALYDEGKIVYVGSTRLLKARISTHMGGSKKFDSYAVFECDSELEMFEIELRLIVSIAPRYNASVTGAKNVGFYAIEGLKKMFGRGALDLKKAARLAGVETLQFNGSTLYNVAQMRLALEANHV